MKITLLREFIFDAHDRFPMAHSILVPKNGETSIQLIIYDFEHKEKNITSTRFSYLASYLAYCKNFASKTFINLLHPLSSPLFQESASTDPDRSEPFVILSLPAVSMDLVAFFSESTYVGKVNSQIIADIAVHHTSAGGLTAKEVMSFIIRIPQKKVVRSLATKVFQLLSSTCSPEFSQVISVKIDPDELISKNYNISDDGKLFEDSTKLCSSMEFCLATFLLRYENKTYYINFTYMDMPLPLETFYGVKKDEVKDALVLASIVAENRMNQQLKSAWPYQVQLCMRDINLSTHE